VFLWRAAAGWSSLLKGGLRSKTWWWITGLGQALGSEMCEENNVAGNDGWPKGGRDGAPGKTAGVDATVLQLRGLPWRSVRRRRMVLRWMEARRVL
jgi:hypothetical protein